MLPISRSFLKSSSRGLRVQPVSLDMLASKPDLQIQGLRFSNEKLKNTCVNAKQRLALKAGASEPQHRGEAAKLQVGGVRRVEESRVQQRLQLRGALQVGPLPRLLRQSGSQLH